MQYNHSMLNFGLFFFSSKWAEVLHVVSDLTESHSPVFFSAGLRFVFQLKRTQKNLAALFAVCCWTTSKRNLLLSRTMKSAKRPVATRKWSANRGRKIQGCDFLTNLRPQAKIQLIWMKKKNRPKFDIEWLCCDLFNYKPLGLTYICPKGFWWAYFKEGLWLGSSITEWSSVLQNGLTLTIKTQF